MATDYHAVIQENIQKQNGTYESNANPFGICGTCGCELTELLRGGGRNHPTWCAVQDRSCPAGCGLSRLP